MIKIRLAEADDCGAIQVIANEPRSTVSYLGGFVMLEPIKSVVKSGSMLVATIDDQIVGFSEALPFGKHCLKMSLVAVTPDLRRQKIGSSLYNTWRLIGNLQGRLYMQDHIISNNPTMPLLLPTIGFTPAVVLRSKVRRHHDLTLWYKSLIPANKDTTEYPDVEYSILDLQKYQDNLEQMKQLLFTKERHHNIASLETFQELARKELGVITNH